jgi:hypothetical protein
MTGPAPDSEQLYERALEAHRRLIARARETIVVALEEEGGESQDTDPPLDPEPCP